MNRLPYVFWDEYTTNASYGDIDCTHAIAHAYILGSFGAVPMRFVAASLATLTVTRRFQSHFAGHITHEGDMQNPGLTVITPWHYHVGSQCFVCFRLMIRLGVFSVEGWYNNVSSFLRVAWELGQENLALYMVTTMRQRFLCRPIGMNHMSLPGTHRLHIPEVMASSGPIVIRWILRVIGEVTPGGLPNNGDLSYMVTPEGLLEMGDWITLAVAMQLYIWRINISEGLSRLQLRRDGTIWHRLVDSENAVRVALFNFMAANPIHPNRFAPYGLVFPTGNTYNTQAQVGWPIGSWHPWALAMKKGDVAASRWFSAAANIDGLELCSTQDPSVIPAMPPGNPATVRAMGFGAALDITENHLACLRHWVTVTRPQLNAFLIQPPSQARRRTIMGAILRVLEQILLTASSKRGAVLDQNISRATKTQRRMDISRTAIAMIYAVQTICQTRTTEWYNPKVTCTYYLWDTPEYISWLEIIKQEDITDVKSIIGALEPNRL